MGLLSQSVAVISAAGLAYYGYDTLHSSKPSLPMTAETSWNRYLGGREVLLHNIGAAHNSSLPLFPDRESWDGESGMYTAWDIFPAAYNCPYELERVGLLGDGGKWVCGMSRYEVTDRPQVMYSFGVGGEVSFEVDFIRRTNIFVHAFDYSVDTLGTARLDGLTSRIKLHQIGIAGSDFTEEGHQFSSLKSIMTSLGHDYIDVLKMDVEGSEFSALDAFMDDFDGKQLPIGQLLIEVHLWEETPGNIQELVKWWTRLESFGLRPVSDEPNLIAVTFGPGYPCCSEYTFININDTRGLGWI